MQPVIRPITGALALMIGLAVCAGSARADVKIRAKSAQGSAVSEQTIYISGSAKGAASGEATAPATAASVSANVKAKDQLTLDLKLQAPDNPAVIDRQFKAKAQSNGEDIISPLIQQAAQAILDAAQK